MPMCINVYMYIYIIHVQLQNLYLCTYTLHIHPNIVFTPFPWETISKTSNGCQKLKNSTELYLYYIFLIHIFDKSFKIILLIMHYSCPFFSLLFSLPCNPCLQHPHLSTCPWVIHISSWASSFTMLFLPSPCLFCTTNYASYSLYFHTHSPPAPFPTDEHPWDPHIYYSVPVPVVFLVCFCFLGLVLIVVSLLSLYCSYFLSSSFS